MAEGWHSTVLVQQHLGTRERTKVPTESGEMSAEACSILQHVPSCRDLR